MDANASYDRLHMLLLHLPVLTTFVAAFFAAELFTRLRQKGHAPHLLWWGIGMVTYGIGTFTEAYTTIAGWDPIIFRCWYIAGAFLGGYPLAQGSIYLLMNRRFADWSARIVTGLIALGSIFVWLTPLDTSQAQAHRLSGAVIEWQWIRAMTPFINIYSLLFLAGGAFYSAYMFFRKPDMRNRFVGNILIAVGAILPGIGGTFTRFGYVEVLYVTELVGLLSIYAGYRKCVAAPRPAAAVPAEAAVSSVSMVLWLALLLGIGSTALPATALAQDEASAGTETAAAEEPDEELSFFAATSVTATGSETDTFDIPTPVIVIDAERIEEMKPDNAADLLRDEPGVDVNGIGLNQARPIIRGQRGLRILFLENGLRMNNPRRQTDFGEVTGLVDIDNVETMEVVRGPASVLYGSDAIGGVLNLITKVPSAGRRFGVHLGMRFSSADEQSKGNVGVSGGGERFSWSLGSTFRSADVYSAPSGSFGDIVLADDTPVNDTDLDDDSINAYLGYRPNDKHGFVFRLNRYRAEQTGFGFVDPETIGDDSGFLIRILYPFQDFDRYTLGYQASGLQAALANTVDFQLYQQENQRQLANDIFINIGPAFGPGSGPDGSVQADTLNSTDLETLGFRAELTKIIGESQVLTYGAEYYEDDSFNTDFSTTTTTLRAFFPISFVCGPEGGTPVFGEAPFPFFQCVFVETDAVANSPNATNTGTGLFIQDEIRAGDRFSASLGLRYAETDTKAEPTPDWDITGLDFSDDAVVGALALTYSVHENLNLVGSYATAFRAPNIIERLFNGLTPEGAGFQLLNPELVSEDSENVDFGLKFRTRRAFFEAIYFDTEIDDAIVQHTLTEDEIAQLPPETQEEIDQSGVTVVVQQRNADVLKIDGVELAGGYRFDNGFSLGGNYTHLSGESETGGPAADPTGDTFSDKWNAFVRYDSPDRRYWLEYRVRHNGEEDVDLDSTAVPGPLGEVLPSFTVHRLAAGLSLHRGDAQEHRLGLIIDNLSDELYAEFSNATFFRPQPERNFIFTYDLRFR